MGVRSSVYSTLADLAFYGSLHYSLRLSLVSPQVSLIMTTPDRWICINVGVDGVDAIAKELSIVWLLVDFFSYYHVSEASNHLNARISLLCD